MRLRYVIYGVFLPLLGIAHDVLLGDRTPIPEYITMFAMGYVIAVADDIAAIADEVKKQGSVRPFLKIGGRQSYAKVGAGTHETSKASAGSRT